LTGGSLAAATYLYSLTVVGALLVGGLDAAVSGLAGRALDLVEGLLVDLGDLFALLALGGEDAHAR
jgi:hypothetical protein